MFSMFVSLFSRIRFGSLWNEKVEESHQDRPESKRIDIQTIKGVQVKNVLPNNCANNNCLFECLIKWN